jgi:glyoxylase-like metal-dependent hydrolase (beta-lactamase superfamily II)
MLRQGIEVIERGWLSSNSILLCDGNEATLIDSGYVSHAAQTVELVRTALGGRRLARLINTHSHSDHIGGNAAVKEAFGCRIGVPEGMAPAIENWDEEALLLSVADQQGAPFGLDHTLAVGERLMMGGLEWQALPAPGHDMDALVFHSADARVLISGDALWRDGFGILFAEVIGSGGGLEAAQATLEAIARLPVDRVIPGHGAPFVEVDEALAAAFARLRYFAAGRRPHGPQRDPGLCDLHAARAASRFPRHAAGLSGGGAAVSRSQPALPGPLRRSPGRMAGGRAGACRRGPPGGRFSLCDMI